MGLGHLVEEPGFALLETSSQKKINEVEYETILNIVLLNNCLILFDVKVT